MRSFNDAERIFDTEDAVTSKGQNGNSAGIGQTNESPMSEGEDTHIDRTTTSPKKFSLGLTDPESQAKIDELRKRYQPRSRFNLLDHGIEHIQPKRKGVPKK